MTIWINRIPLGTIVIIIYIWCLILITICVYNYLSINHCSIIDLTLSVCNKENNQEKSSQERDNFIIYYFIQLIIWYNILLNVKIVCETPKAKTFKVRKLFYTLSSISANKRINKQFYKIA